MLDQIIIDLIYVFVMIITIAFNFFAVIRTVLHGHWQLVILSISLDIFLLVIAISA